jgi:hypothetical protein
MLEKAFFKFPVIFCIHVRVFAKVFVVGKSLTKATYHFVVRTLFIMVDDDTISSAIQNVFAALRCSSSLPANCLHI